MGMDEATPRDEGGCIEREDVERLPEKASEAVSRVPALPALRTRHASRSSQRLCRRHASLRSGQPWAERRE